MDGKFDVFISYRRSDGTELARQVKQYLDSRRIRAYLDTEDMIDGEYFDTQLRKRVVEAAAYVLIATPDVFQFRPENGAEKDWVLEEMRIALREQKNAPYTRKVIPFVPYGTTFPDTLPTGLEDFPRENRIDLKGTVATRQELDRLAESICFVNDCNLWQTGRTTLEQSKAGGGRFCMLDIEDRIMPLYNKKRPPAIRSADSHSGACGRGTRRCGAARRAASQTGQSLSDRRGRHRQDHRHDQHYGAALRQGQNL